MVSYWDVLISAFLLELYGTCLYVNLYVTCTATIGYHRSNNYGFRTQNFLGVRLVCLTFGF